jgi:ribonuclease-3
MSSGLHALAARLGYSFKSLALLQQALTHRSFSLDHNERLEFLGDSVLGLCTAELLFERLAHQPEGDLSRARANLVKQDTLHRLALELGLPAVLRLGEGELRSGGAQRPSILADALEAVIGAIYLDGGYAVARDWVRRLYRSVEINPTMAAMGKDPKTALQERLQGRRFKLPAYRVTATTGAAHSQTFQVACEIGELGLTAVGSGTSRRAAEQAAAQQMLQQMDTVS